MAYSANIGKIKTRKHPDADKLRLGTICGEQVVVGLETIDGELMVYFPCDGQLSKEFSDANDLVGYTDTKTGEKKGGYFGKNRRVKAQKFRGERSDGFACPLSFLLKAGVSEKTVSSLKEGTQFTELDGITICQKYITPATARALKTKQKNNRKKDNICFPQHFDTKQFRYEASQIPAGSILYITEKLHGTSSRYGYVLEEVEVQQPWYKRLFGNKTRKEIQWKHQVGSRRVILKGPEHIGFYNNSKFRYDIMKDTWFSLRKGELIFGEIVGYQENGTPIMPIVSTSPMKDKSFSKEWGTHMEYKYGCPTNECRFYVYRIAMVNEDGHVQDLPWAQVKKRCEILGLQHVPELVGPVVYDGNVENLEFIVKGFVDGPSEIDNSHIREGVCIRVEHDRGIYCLKEKSFPFKVLEGIAKDNSQYVDIEESEG